MHIKMEIEKFIDSLRILREEIEKINITETLKITKKVRNNEKRAKIIGNKKDRWIRTVREKFKFSSNKKQILGKTK